MQHEEAETAANGGPDSPELSCSEEEGLPQISEDRPLETGVPTGALQAKISKRRVSEEEPPLALRLEFLQGPCAGMVYTTPAGTTEVTLGRSATNSVEIPLDTISHHHVFIRWDPLQRCWKVTDVGSLNGTTLNKRRISSEQARVRGAPCTLKSDDLLELSNSAILKVRAHLFFSGGFADCMHVPLPPPTLTHARAAGMHESCVIAFCKDVLLSNLTTGVCHTILMFMERVERGLNV